MGRRKGRGGWSQQNRGGNSGYDRQWSSQQNTGGHGGRSQHRPYRLHEKLSSENREREYKEAQGDFMRIHLFSTVSRYVCGFLNSQVEGKLMFGVTDQCEVIGVNNQYEDRDRKTIDDALRNIRPNVFPQDYDLAYCDILDKHDNKIDNLSLVELTVFRKNNLMSLYETNKRECWQRRDASTEEMSPQQIQDWWRQRTSHNEKEMQNLRSKLADKERLEVQVKDLQSKLQLKEKDASNVQHKCERLEKEIETIKEENKELKEQIQEKDSQKSEEASSSLHRELQDIKNILAKKNKSRVCAIS